MKHRLLNALIIVSTIAILFVIHQRRGGENVRSGLSIEPAVYNIGKFSASSKPLQMQFRIRNETSTPLFITRAVTSCGCITAGVNGSSTLAAGESRPLQVEYRHSNQVNDIRLGVAVSAVDGHERHFSASADILGHGVTAVTSQPASSDLGVNNVGQEPNHAHLLIVRGEEALVWDGIECVADDLRLSVSKIDDRSFSIDVAEKTVDVIGIGRCNLLVYLTLKGQRLDNGKELSIPVRWENVISSIDVHPSAIYLGMMSENSVRSGKIVITPVNGSHIEGISATVDSKRVKVLMSQGNDSVESRYTVSAVYPKTGFSAVLETKVTVNGVEYRIKTPIMGFID